MKILAIDTSTMISSCTLMEDGVVVGDYNINQKKTHSETLVLMIEQMLEKLDVNIEDVDVFCVCKGPGSFTGLRIGMTTAKTFAQVFDKKIVGISTLEALANMVMTDKIIIPILDARGGRVYYSMFTNGNKLNRLMDDDLIYFDELMEKLDDDKEYIFVGDGVYSFLDEINSKENFHLANSSLNNCITRSICDLANKTETFDSYYTLSPDYVRKSQAQRDYEKRHNEN
ncbi:tRNA (adenosine(37)-N6)-threonylcarbamoyltransferase complex dimerization subunit type 1 TsaB [uncultured Finegoldia sp.]|uniref:tRNA (adenosine(37)-N6)-threonylcarbamoyltransferase complex dimerization subunit type 1 TsaB n=1 Tax=uncultured Finegoldia sp. TaxID=328009 RepID=UPI002619C0E7|nr:tRNA (adenosine(37)-N6)-threonylcarbamoyltransferase complex dimerization subunit type 1 TsaB [uncultured Finegoldia sp.]